MSAQKSSDSVLEQLQNGLLLRTGSYRRRYEETFPLSSLIIVIISVIVILKIIVIVIVKIVIIVIVLIIVIIVE